MVWFEGIQGWGRGEGRVVRNNAVTAFNEGPIYAGGRERVV